MDYMDEKLSLRVASNLRVIKENYSFTVAI